MVTQLIESGVTQFQDWQFTEENFNTVFKMEEDKVVL